MRTRPQPDLYTAARRLWLGRVRRPVQAWCDANLRLSSRVAWQAGPWDTMAFPYEAGIFWLWQHSRVEMITLQWGTRLGKTVLIPALAAWAACNDPGPALVATATRDSAHSLAREKLYPMLEDCQETAALLLPESQRAFPVIDLRQMLVYLAWAGSTAALAEKAIRYAFLTELDKWPMEASREADPETLALERTKDWPNRKILKEGTPTIEGLSRLEANMKASEVVLEYHVPCPHCGGFQVLSFAKGVKWVRDGERNVPSLARDTAYYECQKCQEAILDEHRHTMLRRGVWAPMDYKIEKAPSSPVLWGEGGPRRRVGTHLSSLYSPTLTWGEMAETFLLYSKDPRKLQDWVNAWEARTWRVQVDVPEWATLRTKLATETPRAVLPSWAQWLTAGIDVHRWKDVYSVLAWAPGPRVALVESAEVREGTTEKDRIANALLAVLERAWTDSSGRSMQVRLACVDSGYSTDDVYSSVNHYGIMRARAIKGATTATGARAPWIMSTVQADPSTGKRPERAGQMVFILDASYWQGVVNSMLVRDPKEPGCLLMHADPDETLMRSVCNVAPYPKRDTRGREVLEYRVVEDEYGDHVHDSICYAVAAADMLGIRLLEAERKASAPVRVHSGGSASPGSWRIGR